MLNLFRHSREVSLLEVILYYMSHYYFYREERIAENMKRMPEIIAEYRNKMAELRKKARKVKTDEEKYRIATGRAKPEGLEYKKTKKK